MNKKFIFILLIFLATLSFSFPLNKEKYKWYTIKQLEENKDKLKPFDIILLDIEEEFHTKNGHIFLVNKDIKLIEIQGFKQYFSDYPIYGKFYLKDRPLTILRYKKMDDKLADLIDAEIPNYYNKEYNVFSSFDEDNIDTYCSLFIHSLFKVATKKYGNEIKITKEKWPILPFDFLENEYFENVDLQIY